MILMDANIKVTQMLVLSDDNFKAVNQKYFN